MPYATKRKRSYSAYASKRSRPSATRRRTTRRKTAKPYTRKVPVRNKTATRINKSRIAKLEEKVNGHYQKGYHSLSVRYNPVPNGFVWSPRMPLLVALNDFYTQTTAPNGGCGAVYYPTFSGPVGAATTQAAILDRWQDYIPNDSLGLAPQYQQWKDQIASQPSKIGYQPLGSDITITINRTRCTPEQGDLWVRVDCFHAKKTFLLTAPGAANPDPKNFNMPNALGALAHMAVSANTRTNAFNPALWSVSTRWIKLPAVDQDSQNIINTFHVKTRFPKKFLSLNTNVDPATGVGEQFYNACPPGEIKWMMLSLSAESVDQTTNPTPQIFMKRQVAYRDSRGAAM